MIGIQYWHRHCWKLKYQVRQDVAAVPVTVAAPVTVVRVQSPVGVRVAVAAVTVGAEAQAVAVVPAARGKSPFQDHNSIAIYFLTDGMT